MYTSYNSSLKRRTPLTAKVGLTTKTPLKSRVGLKSKTPLKSKGRGFGVESAPSIMQGYKASYFSGKQEGLVKHHIWPGRRRKASDGWGCWVWLTVDEHTGDCGIHNDPEAMRALQDECRERFISLHGESKFVEVFGH